MNENIKEDAMFIKPPDCSKVVITILFDGEYWKYEFECLGKPRLIVEDGDLVYSAKGKRKE